MTGANLPSPIPNSIQNAASEAMNRIPQFARNQFRQVMSYIPGMQNMPSMPNMPNMPSMPNMPQMNLPNMPNMPNMPSLPNMNLPQMPQMNLPNMPNMPQMNLPNLPNISGMMSNLNSLPDQMFQSMGMNGMNPGQMVSQLTDPQQIMSMLTHLSNQVSQLSQAMVRNMPQQMRQAVKAVDQQIPKPTNPQNAS